MDIDDLTDPDVNWNWIVSGSAIKFGIEFIIVRRIIINYSINYLFVFSRRPPPSLILHPSPSTIIHHHPPSSITVHHHPSPSITIHHHPSPSTIIHHRPPPSITVHHRPPPSITVHHRPSPPSPTITTHFSFFNSLHGAGLAVAVRNFSVGESQNCRFENCIVFFFFI